MTARILAAVGAAIVGSMALIAAGPAEAHGWKRDRHAPPVIVVPPPGRHAAPYPYWYYGRPVHPRHRPPPTFAEPGARYYAPPPFRHRHKHRHWRGPGVTFDFRF